MPWEIRRKTGSIAGFMKRLRYNRPPRTIPGTTEEILSFLAAHGTRDKDFAEPVPEKPVVHRIERRKGGVLRETLDLHGLTSDEASLRLRLIIELCQNHGVKELLIIHGQGRHSAPAEGPVLKNLVREMLENELRLSVLRFRSGLPREGGEGATIAYLA
jgi:DNA-nicking Smr family endonuclease